MEGSALEECWGDGLWGRKVSEDFNRVQPHGVQWVLVISVVMQGKETRVGENK